MWPLQVLLIVLMIERGEVKSIDAPLGGQLLSRFIVYIP
jgi:hypothetical protein